MLQTQVLYHRHVYNATDTSDVLRHYSGRSSRSKGLICTCDGGAVSLCLGLSQPLPKDHLALSMLNIYVQLALSFISSPIISPQLAICGPYSHVLSFSASDVCMTSLPGLFGLSTILSTIITMRWCLAQTHQMSASFSRRWCSLASFDQGRAVLTVKTRQCKLQLD